MPFLLLVNGITLLFFAALMGMTALVFPATAGVFYQAGLYVGGFGALLCLSVSSARPRLHRLHGFLMTASVWLVAALAGAVPLWLYGLTPLDAVFESMSGITTTGSTVMVGLDSTPRGILFWRAVLQVIGGIGFIVTGMALLPILKVGGMQLFRTESSDKDEKQFGSAARFASATLTIYGALILACALVYSLGGMNAFDALTHAMTTLSTGGYSNYDASFGHFESPFLQWSGTLFMLLGALPFAWYLRAVTRRRFGSEQVRYMLLSLGMVIVGLSAWLVIEAGMDPEEALRLTAFNVVSVVTTTGYATTDYTTWGAFAVTVFFLLTAVGGCTGSTSGGAKAMRWIVLARSFREQLSRVTSPHVVAPIRYEGKAVDPDVIAGIAAFFAIYFGTFMVLTVALNLVGLDFATASSGALTSLANVGPGVGSIIGPAGNFATLPHTAKVILTFAMYAGRLEMVTVFVLLLPDFWREVTA